MKIDLHISDNLKQLANLLPKPLFVVGGYVRDFLLNFDNSDIDLASSCTPDEIFECLQGTNYIVKTTSPKLMTLKIVCGDEYYEYTTFRRESYTKGHSPAVVESTDDIVEDAKRRDFKINAIYYDIKNQEICDPLNGLEDIKNKVITTVTDAKKVFGEDGLRLMRLARMCGEIGFTPSEMTVFEAKNKAELITDIAIERIRDELDKILVADTRNNIENGHVNALLLLDKIDVLSKILPELMMGKGMKQRADFHKYDVFNHIVETFRVSDPQIRLAALLHDIAKPTCFIKNGRYYGHDMVGEQMAKDIMIRFHYPNKTINRVCELVKYHMFDLKCEAKPNTLRLFVQEHSYILPDLLLLKKADAVGSGMNFGKNASIERLKNTYEQMIKEKIPFNFSQLLITGEDLNGIEPKDRGKVMQKLLRDCALLDSRLSTRDEQLKYIQKFIN
jgi:tRNA nucleotidyltransferase (CCA-adding enzyme)